MSKLPSTQMARAGLVGSTALKVGVGKLKGKAKRPFLSEIEKQSDKEQQQDAEAELLFKAITQLRGTAVKLAQMLGMETDLLPKRVTDELAKSYYQIPPLNRVLVRKAILDELGDTPENLFARFDSVAMAAASLGQVHIAELNDGQAAAVKIQYPGIHVSIESDMKLLRKLSGGGIKFLPKHRQPSPQVLEKTLIEIAERLKEETNYVLEAESTAWFRENLKIDGVSVPEVYKEYCAERVITTQLLDGVHLDKWLATDPPQDCKDRAAQKIYDVFVTSTMELGRVHADPNPGNYLFKPNGDISLIDFGCVKSLGEVFVKNLPKLLHAFYLADINKIIEAYAAIGVTLTFKNREELQAVMQPVAEWFSLPVKEAYFDFKEHAGYNHSGFELLKNMSEKSGLDSMNEDFIFFDRTLYGLFRIFERLDAKVFMRAHWEKRWA